MPRRPAQRRNASGDGLQPPAMMTNGNNSRTNNNDNGEKKTKNKRRTSSSSSKRRLLLVVLLTVVVGFGWMGYCTYYTINQKDRVVEVGGMVQQQQQQQRRDTTTTTTTTTIINNNNNNIPQPWKTVYERAQAKKSMCQKLPNADRKFDLRNELPFHNDTVASLPSFGIVEAIENYYYSDNNADQKDNYSCQLPPPDNNECSEQQFTVIFMAYNPDRLDITTNEIRRMLDKTIFQNYVKEVILVWNGIRQINETKHGQNLLHDYVEMPEIPVRVVHPLKMGFTNDLMNRYHPKILGHLSGKALLYYDDDGPFYSPQAIISGFELWKRHPRSQIGAMARQITLDSKRQKQEQQQLLGIENSGNNNKNPKKTKPNENEFISYCTNLPDAEQVVDHVDYNFRYFANYDANMVLPSGSFLHANYLECIWHPIFAEIRKFVRLHPVHPDDMTVSFIVSQLAGKAPRVYSRRLNNPAPTNEQKKKRHRRLLSNEIAGGHDDRQEEEDDIIMFDAEASAAAGEEQHDTVVSQSSLEEKEEWQQQRQYRHRRLMFSICWDCGSGMTEMKQYWAELRTEAVNSLVRYFGSINSGSIGWCENSAAKYYNPSKDGRCDPIMAKQGWLPWMKTDGSPKDTCP